jgi:hypothetical protein
LASENITVLDCFWVSLNSSTSIKTISITGHCRHLPLFQGAPSSLLLVPIVPCYHWILKATLWHSILPTFLPPWPLRNPSLGGVLASNSSQPIASQWSENLQTKVGGLHPPLRTKQEWDD